MLNLRRATWIAGTLVLLGVAATAFTKPPMRPVQPYRPPPIIQPPRPPVWHPQPQPKLPSGWPGTTIPKPPTWPSTRPPTIVIQPPRYRPQAEVKAGIEARMRVRPAEAIGLLRTPEAKAQLPAAVRADLARKTIAVLAVAVERGGEPVKSLHQVRDVRRDAADLAPEVRSDLQKLHSRAERRVLAECIQDVRGRAERGDWPEVIEKTNRWLELLHEPRTPAEQLQESADFRARRAEVRTALIEVRDLGRQLQVLEQFGAQLRGLDGQKAAEAARTLAGVDSARLPAPLRRSAEALRGAAELRARAAERWTQPPNVAELKASVARLERGLIDAPQFDAHLGKQIQQALAVKAFIEGHATEYFRLMPEAAPAEHAAQQLRDLKALALGEGKVESWPASASLPPGRGPDSPRAPPGLEPLVPEAGRAGWRPPGRESPRADLPPLERAAELAVVVKAKAQADARPEKAKLETQAQAAQQRLGDVRQRVLAPELKERARLSEIEAELDRRLSAAERVRARALIEQGRTNRQVAQELPGAAGENDEDAQFLHEVAARLGVVRLTDDQKARALRLKRQGRTAAEVAVLLRM